MLDRNTDDKRSKLIDTLLRQIPHLRKPGLWDRLRLREKEYFVTTLHRPTNVDGESTLANLLRHIATGTRGLPVIFPVHPRTAKNLQANGFSSPSIHAAEPLGYLEFNYLVQRAKAVITDSGGITEETTVMGVPCLTMRDNTERPETITLGTNELVGTDPGKLRPHLDRLFAGQWKNGGIPPLWDGKASERIVAHLERLLS